MDLICVRQVLEWGRSPYSAESQVMTMQEKLVNLRRVLQEPKFSTIRVVSLYTTPLVGS